MCESHLVVTQKRKSLPMNKFTSKVLGVSALGVTAAQAAVPASIQTAFDSAATDSVEVVGIVAGALVLFIAAGWIIKAVRTGK